MVKIIALLKRKEGLSREEFSRYWADRHGPLIVRVYPQIRRYVQNHLVVPPGGPEPPYDGVAEVWFDSLEDWQETARFYASEEGRVIRDDEDKFMDNTKMVVLLVREEKLIKG